MRLCIELSDPLETARVAQTLAPWLGIGDLLLLRGDIGAGKTHFARAVITTRLADLGRVEDIPSPSFTLVQTYDLETTELWHADLYRLSGPGEIHELGLEQAIDDAICLIEWPERMGEHAPASALNLTFEITGDVSRKLTIAAQGAKWDKCLKVLGLAESITDD